VGFNHSLISSSFLFFAIAAQVVELPFVLITRLTYLGQAPDHGTNAESLDLRSSEISRVDRSAVGDDFVLQPAVSLEPKRSQPLSFVKLPSGEGTGLAINHFTKETSRTNAATHSSI
jgi:hypothetical protein